MATTTKGTGNAEAIAIKPAKFAYMALRIIGTAPYVQHQFSQKARNEIIETQEKGSASKSRKKREAKDFDEEFRQSMHLLPDGSPGIPAGAFRNAMVDACRLAGFVMTKAKMSVFVEADGFDPETSNPLVRITKGEPEKFMSHVRLPSGPASVCARARWQPGWEAKVVIRYDTDQFQSADIVALMDRVGQQVGIGEGRPFSKNSCGMGWGLFRIATEDDKE